MPFALQLFHGTELHQKSQLHASGMLAFVLTQFLQKKITDLRNYKSQKVGVQ
jgi:hypothetical protein